jgi:hypothetical protein
MAASEAPTAMAFRDDREALRERVFTLQSELDAAREELLLGRAKGPRARPRRALVAGLVGVALVGLGAGWSRLIPAPHDTLPRTCPPNGKLTVSGVSYDGPGPVIVTGANCSVTITDSRIKSDVVLRAGGDLKLTVRRSTLIGSEVAIDLPSSNAKVDLLEGTVVSGTDGLRGTLDVQLTMQDSKILASHDAIRGKTKFELDAADAEIRGGASGIDADSARLELHRTTVSSEGVAVHVNANARVNADRATIVGGDAALDCPGALQLSLANASRARALKTAIQAGRSADIVVDSSVVEGGELGVSLSDWNGTLTARGGRISGTKGGARGGDRLDVRLEDATVESDGVALAARTGRIVATRSLIRGTAAAFVFEKEPALELDGDSALSGPREYPSR